MKSMSIFMVVAPILAIGALLLLVGAGVAAVTGFLTLSAVAFSVGAAIHFGLKLWYKQLTPITIGE